MLICGRLVCSFINWLLEARLSNLFIIATLSTISSKANFTLIMPFGASIVIWSKTWLSGCWSRNSQDWILKMPKKTFGFKICFFNWMKLNYRSLPGSNGICLWSDNRQICEIHLWEIVTQQFRLNWLELEAGLRRCLIWSRMKNNRSTKDGWNNRGIRKWTWSNQKSNSRP